MEVISLGMERPRPTHVASHRAKSELAHARDVRLGPWAALLAGAFAGWAAIFLKASVNEALGGDSGYILLVAASVVAAWVGGVVGGLMATLVAFILDSVIFVSPDGGLIAATQVDVVRQVLYALVAVGTVLLIGSRRASRDRLEDALDASAALAEEIEARDDRLELMLAASGTGFWEWDIPSGDLVWSDAIFEQHGLLPGGDAPDFPAYLGMLHADDREPFQAAIAEALAGERTFDIEFRVLWPDGSIHWTRGSARVFRDEDGAPMRMLGTGQDITERRRVEAQRDDLLLEERRAAEFREAFIDVISHELRTPVTTILGAAQILARSRRHRDDDARDSLLDDIHLEAERLHRLVEDLLVLTRAERGRLVADVEPLSVQRLVERVVRGIGPELPSIQIDLAIDRDLPIVSGEATYVEQVLRNLLGNAAKYSPPGTPVTVSAARAGGSVAIRVLDAGPGIVAGSERRLFDLFYRSPEQARLVAGSGIGLFVCASLVEAMGGRIWAAQRPTGGAEFGFALRVLESDEEGLEIADVMVHDEAMRSVPQTETNQPHRRSSRDEHARADPSDEQHERHQGDGDGQGIDQDADGELDGHDTEQADGRSVDPVQERPRPH
jgi:signal transduction histidine kinase